MDQRRYSILRQQFWVTKNRIMQLPGGHWQSRTVMHHATHRGRHDDDDYDDERDQYPSPHRVFVLEVPTSTKHHQIFVRPTAGAVLFESAVNNTTTTLNSGWSHRFNVQHFTMTDVWYQIFIGDVSVGQPDMIEGLKGWIVDLKKKIKEEAKNRLAHCDPLDLDVYDRGTTVPVPEEMKPLPLSRDVPNNTEEEKPLIVIAPPRTNQQQQGELRFCRAINDFDLLFHSS